MSDRYLNILLIEDNLGDAVLFREALNDLKAHYDLKHVLLLADAKKELKENIYDVILLDLSLPDGKGIENIKSVNEWSSKTPVVVLTGLNDQEVATEALRKGAQDYLIKGEADGGLFWKSMCYAVERKTIEEKLQLAKEKAEGATKAKSEFLAHMSHEIRSPLNIILGAAEALSRTSLTSEQEQYINMFKTSSDVLLSIINDILDLSRLEADKMEAEKVKFELVSLIDDLKNFYSISAEKKGIQLVFSVSKNIPRQVVGDPLRLRQVLFNLIGNAIKFTEKGSITLSVREEKGKYLFVVKDTGLGIPADKTELIFESFTQSKNSISRNYGGSGLGLAICKKLTALMGGEIWVESVEGKGSSFCFTITCFTEKNKNEKEEGREEPELLNGTKEDLELLIVDDSSDSRMLVKAFLKNENITVCEADSGEKALEVLNRKKFDLILMDMNMGEMDGCACLEKMREMGPGSLGYQIPIVAFTANAEDVIKERCKDVSFSSILHKPTSQVELLKCIANFRKEKSCKNEDKVKKESVFIEEGLKEIVPQYLHKKKKDIDVMGSLLEQEEWVKVQRLGHNMAGTGSSYGFVKISKIGFRIEEAAKNKNKRELQDEINGLSSYLSSIKVVYQ